MRLTEDVRQTIDVRHKTGDMRKTINGSIRQETETDYKRET